MTLDAQKAAPPVKLALLSSLYFSQGLPYGFFTQALPVLLRKEGYSLEKIGLSYLLVAPWALKFLWAPLIDHNGPRRAWIIPLQIAAALLMGVVALAKGSDLDFLLGVVFLVNLIAATQDVATDGFAVDILTPEERGLGNGIQVAGYRVGMITGGGALLIAFDHIGWTATFATMSGFLVAATVPIFVTHEPPRVTREPSAVKGPHFLLRRGMAGPLLLLLVYKFGEAFAQGMLRPYLADLGLGLSDIGAMLGTVGFGAGLAGALAGGVLVGYFGRQRALIIFAVTQAAAVSGYAAVASTTSPDLEVLYIVAGLEHFTSGLATVSLFTAMMDWSRAESSATDYTVQASAVVISTGSAAALSGLSAGALGYFWHFVLAVALCLISVAAAALLFPKHTA